MLFFLFELIINESFLSGIWSRCENRYIPPIFSFFHFFQYKWKKPILPGHFFPRKFPFFFFGGPEGIANLDWYWWQKYYTNHASTNIGRKWAQLYRAKSEWKLLKSINKNKEQSIKLDVKVWRQAQTIKNADALSQYCSISITNALETVFETQSKKL